MQFSKVRTRKERNSLEQPCIALQASRLSGALDQAVLNLLIVLRLTARPRGSNGMARPVADLDDLLGF
jgi:hypothetical protein